MFTGIVKETAQVKNIDKKPYLWNIGIESKEIYKEVNTGDSVSVNGVCLTVVDKKRNTIYFQSVKATLDNTNLKRLKINSYVNLEPALRVNETLGGHFVLGHIDCEGQIIKIQKVRDYLVWNISYNKKYANLLIEKGSIAIEGVSLTISSIEKYSFAVNIIPYTLKNTNFSKKKIGDWVNLEFDYLAKCVEKMLRK